MNLRVLEPTGKYELVRVSRNLRASGDTKAAIEADLVRALPDLKMREYFDAMSGWFSDPEYMVTARLRSTGECVGLVTALYLEVADAPPFLRLGSIFVAKTHRGTHMMMRLISEIFAMVLTSRRDFPTWVVLKTCNALAFGAMSSFQQFAGFKFYPQTDGREQDPLMAEMAARIAGHIAPRCHFDRQNGVIKDCSVPPDLYVALPDAGKPPILRYLETHISPADRVLCLGLICTDDAKRRIMRRLGLNAGVALAEPSAM